ncbi:annexin a11 [Acrodontium crateriforme]|uniref:Annexin a11 n=1 Tax=Acrodontium crateriforme TaxID=150365 RepID=A0AAQ3RA94_9PEZI|nr:annexin a11 [Acrodontium crateriforme]
MSYLRADDRSSRARDKSATRDRSRSRGDVYSAKAPSPPSGAGYGYAPPPKQASVMPGSFSNGDDEPTYEVRAPAGASDRPSKYAPQPPSAQSRYSPPRQHQGSTPYPGGDFTMGDYKDFPPEERPGYVPPRARFPSMPLNDDDHLAYGDSAPAANNRSRHAPYSNPYPQESPFPSMPSDPSSYRYNLQRPNPADPRSSSHNYQYAPAPEKITYTAKPQTGLSSKDQRRREYSSDEYRDGAHVVDMTPKDQRHASDKITYTAKPQTGLSSKDQRRRDYSPDEYRDGAHVVDMTPRDQRPGLHQRGHSPDEYYNDRRSKDERPGAPPRGYSESEYRNGANVVDMTPGHDRRDRTTSVSKGSRLLTSTYPPGMPPPPSPGLGPRMGMLSVGGDGGGHYSNGGAGGMPPPSPLLEAYHGTWQSISPMPLAIRPDDDDLSDLEPLDGPPSRHGGKKNDKLDRDAKNAKEKDKKDDKKRVKLYDPESDAKAIASALKHSKVDADKIIDVLPGLSHDQIWEVRKEYKKQVKIQGKGINLPKHLKMKVTGNFGKAVYVTALGRWESEGYWANFWYQSHGSRRELLIESLMGRTNSEMGYIKDDFKDKRYSDSLVKCMEKELKMDKFRTAVLMALEARRQDEQDVYPQEYRNRDVDTLHRALTAKQGGETAMLEVIIRRSDAHLREVLRTYERMHKENFARAALRKSNNLVGEVIAHILNGVINKPARDALLLRHAIKDIAEKNKDDELRYELLISRLVRLHWDKMHLMRVRREYTDKFGKDLQEDIEDATKGDFREFMCELCEVK